MDDSGLPDAADEFTIIEPVPPPPLRLTDAKGKKLSLADYAGHVLVVNIWATWCGPCVEEIPTLAALAKEIHHFGGLVLPISIDIDGAQAVEPFYEQHHITTLPVLLDPDGINLDLLHTDGVPVTIILNPAGKMVARLDGGADWNTPRVRAFLQLLAQPKSKPTTQGATAI